MSVLCAILTARPPGMIQLTISTRLMNLLEDRISVPVSFTPSSVELKSRPAQNDGGADMVGAISLPEFGAVHFVAMAKFHNARMLEGEEGLLAWFNAQARQRATVPLEGVWRFWGNEAEGTFALSPKVPPRMPAKPAGAHPNHIFEIAPILTVKKGDLEEDLRQSIRWIPGFTGLQDKLKTRNAFRDLNRILCKARMNSGNVTLNTGPQNFNYLGFTAVCTTAPRELVDGYALEGDIYDQDGNGLPGETPLYPRMRLLIPKGTQGEQHINATLGQRIRVFGIPRLSLHKLRPALEKPKHAFQGPLPTEIIVLGSLEFK